MEVNLDKDSLVLFKDGRKIHSSTHSGVRPLFECIESLGNRRDCILHDRAVGLAAARLIVFSKGISKVYTRIISRPAADHLDANNIKWVSDLVVPFILRMDKTGPCPMELRAHAKDDKVFYEELKKLFSTTNIKAAV